MQSGNPTLNPKVFSEAKVYGAGQAMTVQGTVNKTLVLLAVLMVTAVWTWSKAFDPTAGAFVGGLFLGGLIGGLVLALVTVFKPAWSPVTAPLYTACQGLVLGLLSAHFEARYPGIVMQAVGLTFATSFAMLLGYKAGWLKATPALRKGLMIAMGGLMIFYVAVWIASMFGIHPPAFINGGGPLGIAFSLVIVGIAAMNLIIDFDFIETAAREGAEKKMEWYGAFALMVTLIGCIWKFLDFC